MAYTWHARARMDAYAADPSAEHLAELLAAIVDVVEDLERDKVDIDE
ncbi:hypothetical protein ACWCO0_09535 [Streptomyces tubercidicus]